MLDGTLFIVKCARYGNPGKNACSDFFLSFKAFFLNAVVFLKKTVMFLKKMVMFLKKMAIFFRHQKFIRIFIPAS